MVNTSIYAYIHDELHLLLKPGHSAGLPRAVYLHREVHRHGARRGVDGQDGPLDGVGGLGQGRAGGGDLAVLLPAEVGVPVGAAARVLLAGDRLGEALEPGVGDDGGVGAAGHVLAQRLDAVVPVREPPLGRSPPHLAARRVVVRVQALVQQVQAVQVVVAGQVRHVPAAALGRQPHRARRRPGPLQLLLAEAYHARWWGGRPRLC